LILVVYQTGSFGWTASDLWKAPLNEGFATDTNRTDGDFHLKQPVRPVLVVFQTPAL